MSNENVDPFEAKISGLVRHALQRHQWCLESRSSKEASEITNIVNETTQKIIEEVKAEVKAAMEEIIADSEKKLQDRDRKYWKDHPDAKRWGKE